MKTQISLAICLLLCGCGTSFKLANPTVVYPELSDVPTVPDPDLQPVEFDFPRDTSKTVAKNLTDCINKPVKQLADDCLEHPVDAKSNLFIGVDNANWSILQLDLLKQRLTIEAYKQRISEVNDQRAQWRALNKGK